MKVVDGVVVPNEGPIVSDAKTAAQVVGCLAIVAGLVVATVAGVTGAITWGVVERQNACAKSCAGRMAHAAADGACSCSEAP